MSDVVWILYCRAEHGHMLNNPEFRNIAESQPDTILFYTDLIPSENGVVFYYDIKCNGLSQMQSPFDKVEEEGFLQFIESKLSEFIFFYADFVA